MSLTYTDICYSVRVLFGAIFNIAIALSGPTLHFTAARAQEHSPPQTPPAQTSISLPTNCGMEKFKTLRIEKVVDAENLLLSDGSEYQTGVLASDLDDPAAHNALSRLVSMPITIYQESGTPSQPDRYGRVSGPATIQSSSGEEWLQAKLIAAGLARVVPGDAHTACTAALLALENKSRKDQRGHWQTGIFSVLHASDPQKILRQVNRFGIVEGSIVRRSKSHGRTYLNFGRDWKDDFTVNISARLVRRQSKQSANPTHDRSTRSRNPNDITKPGTRIRVRGWVENRNGPMIKIESLDQIEVLD